MQDSLEEAWMEVWGPVLIILATLGTCGECVTLEAGLIPPVEVMLGAHLISEG